MSLPFLKSKEGSMSAPIEVEVRKPDEGMEPDMLDAIADDLLHAIATKDASLLKEVLEALVDHMRNLDEEQDSFLESGE